MPGPRSRREDARVEDPGAEAAREPSATSAPSASGRDIETHFTVVAVIEFALAGPLLLFGLFVAVGGLVGAGFAEAFSGVPALGSLIAGAGLLVGLLFVGLALPAIASAVGLLQRKSWAKVLTLVVAVLNLLNIPVGTIFGIYAIWVMTRPETDRALGRTPKAGPSLD